MHTHTHTHIHTHTHTHTHTHHNTTHHIKRVKLTRGDTRQPYCECYISASHTFKEEWGKPSPSGGGGRLPNIYTYAIQHTHSYS